MSTDRQADYAAALLPDRHRVCGVLMQIHTLGHALLLRRLRSPYALGSGAGLPGLGDTVLAAYVCSRSWERASHGVDSFWIRVWIRVRSWRRWHREQEDVIAMSAYLQQAWATPTTFGTKRGGAERGSDRLQVLVSRQRKVWGKSLPQALSTSVSEAVLDHLEQLEESGDIRLWGPRDSALRSKLEEIQTKREMVATPNATN